MPEPLRRTVDVLDAIARVVAPVLGETMARAAPRSQCAKLGIDGAQIDAEQVEALIAKVASGLNIFVGREKASALVQQMRYAIETGRS
jgi:malonyl CoA-acyl carrier protein transacylase